MQRLAALFVLLLLSTGAQAIPNIWSSSFAQGFTEYSIANNRLLLPAIPLLSQMTMMRLLIMVFTSIKMISPLKERLSF